MLRCGLLARRADGSVDLREPCAVPATHLTSQGVPLCDPDTRLWRQGGGTALALPVTTSYAPERDPFGPRHVDVAWLTCRECGRRWATSSDESLVSGMCLECLLGCAP